MIKRSSQLISAAALSALVYGGASENVWAQNDAWTGAHFGAHFGYDRTRFKFSGGPSVTDSGAIGGLLGGINFFQSGNVVVGAEADISWLDATANKFASSTTPGSTSLSISTSVAISTSTSTSVTTIVTGSTAVPVTSTITNTVSTTVTTTTTVTTPATTTTTSLNAELNWKATLRARGGFLMSPTLFVYATAGVAWADMDVSLSVNGVGVSSTNPMLFGGVYGGGVETLITPNMLARIEVLHFDFQEETVNFGAVPTKLNVDETVGRIAVSFKLN